MRRLLGLGVVVVASCTSHPGFERIDSCASCGRGDVVNGAIVRSSSIGWAARPNGGWVRVDDHDLAWADPLYELDHETDVALDGDLAVLAVGPDDTAVVAASTTDDFDSYVALAAVAPDGSVRWRRDPVMSTEAVIHAAATGDAVIVYGVTQYPIALDGAMVSGLFVARLDPATGAVAWTWSSPSQRDSVDGADVEVVPRADGTLVVAGTVRRPSGSIGAATLDLGGATASFTSDTAGFAGVLDASGHGAWVRALAGPTRVGVYQAGLLDDGGIAIAGDFSGAPLDLGNGVTIPTGAMYEDQFVAVLEPDGTTRWATPVGDGIAEHIRSLAVRESSVVVAGSYADHPLSFGDATMPANLDAFVASITGGALDWVTEVHGPEYETATVVARAGALDAVVRDLPTTDPGPRSFDIGRVHVDGDAVLFANLIP